MSRLLAFIFLEKSARDRLERKRTAKQTPARPDGARRPAAAQSAAASASAIASGPPMSQERAELIAQAMKIRRQKQDVLADLSEEDRAKLISTLLGKSADSSE